MKNFMRRRIESASQNLPYLFATKPCNQKLAAKTFKRVLEYDEAISSYFDQHILVSGTQKKIPLSYGENPGQEAFLLQTKNKVANRLLSKPLALISNPLRKLDIRRKGGGKRMYSLSRIRLISAFEKFLSRTLCNSGNFG